MSKSKTSQDKHLKIAEHYCTTYLGEASTSMEWSISNFDLLKIDSTHTLESLSFESVAEGVHTGTWKMKLVPKYGKKDCIGLFFNFTDNIADMSSVFAEFQACLIDEDGKETNKMELASELVLINDPGLGFDEFIKKSNLVDSLLPDGVLTIRCNITVIRMTSTGYKAGQLEEGNSLGQDLSLLMKDDSLSDAILVTTCGRRFPIHKCILSARSTVFSDKFKSEGQEHEKSIELKDIEADVLENVLSYIYTDEILENCTSSMALKLLIAANEFNLEELKWIAEEYLEKQVSEKNLLEIASAAELHKLTSLKEVCIAFMCENGKEIAFSENSTDFLSNAPQFLVKGVFKQLFGGPSPDNEQRVPKSNPCASKQVTSCPSCDPNCKKVPTPAFKLPLLSEPAPFAFGSTRPVNNAFAFGQNSK